MTRFAAALLLILSALIAPAAAVAAEDWSSPGGTHAPAQENGSAEDAPGDPWGEVVIWSVVGLGLFAAVGGALYYFKRQVGGFPENPTWVAPITIMPSKDFPDEGDYGDSAGSHQAHAEH
jgi:hypothetical protein